MCEKKGGLGGKLGCFAVAPYAGAWIEILVGLDIPDAIVNVAPYAGAWIEMFVNTGFFDQIIVAPYAGAWIEINSPAMPCI